MTENRTTNLLRQLLAENALTQAGLGEILGLSQQATSDRLNGRTALNQKDVRRLAEHFKMAEQDFFGPPRHPSRFGYTGEAGTVFVQPNPQLMERVIEHVERWLQRHQASMTIAKRAGVITQIYRSVGQRALDRGVDEHEIEISEFDQWLDIIAEKTNRSGTDKRLTA